MAVRDQNHKERFINWSHRLEKSTKFVTGQKFTSWQHTSFRDFPIAVMEKFISSFNYVIEPSWRSLKSPDLSVPSKSSFHCFKSFSGLMKSKEVTSCCTRLYIQRDMLLCFYSRSWCWCPTRGLRKLFLRWQNREMQYSGLYDQWVCSALTKTQGVSHCCDSLSILQKSLHSITHC